MAVRPRARYDSKALRRLRAERGLSRQEVARRAQMSVNNVLYIERGTVPGAKTLAKLATALGVTPNEFYEHAG